MDGTDRSGADRAADVLMLLLADREAGDLRPLAHYLALFPGCEETVAAEYLAFAAPPAEGNDIASPPPGSVTAGDRPEPRAGSGPRLGPYILDREIGRGGQAVVWLATDSRLGRKVAVKILTSTLGMDAGDVLARFRREAEVASRLDHPGLCTVHDAGVENGTAYIAMRFVEGESLAARIAGRRAAAGRAPRDASGEARPRVSSSSAGRREALRLAALVEAAARALHVVHEAGIVHRDIKPANIMVTPAGEPVLMDFGLARDHRSGDASLTRTGEIFGTPSYMSPEQLRLAPSALDRRTDVWSLGVTLYEAVTLRRPFDEPTRELLCRAIERHEPPDPRTLDPSVPRDLAVIVLTALEKDRDRRYQSALHLAEDLERLRLRQPIRARPAGPLLRLARWAARRPALAAGLGGFVVLLVTALLITLWFLGEKAAALAEVTRLSDLARLRDLETRAGQLRPSVPERVGGEAGMTAWIDAAREILSRRDIHAATLERVRRRAAPAPGGGGGAFAARRAELARQGEDLRRERGRVAALRYGGRDELLARIDRQILNVEEELRNLASWSSVDTRETWLFGTLVELVRALERLEDGVADMESRRTFALSVDQMSIGDHQAAWDRAMREIADPSVSPAYGGLRIRPQRGLVPLGADPRSGLHEFAHLETGAVSVRDPESGRASMGETEGLVFVLLPGGRFAMGAVPPEPGRPSGPNVDLHAQERDRPVNEVALAPFFLSKFEMTQGQWLRVTGRHPSQFGPGREIAGTAGRPGHVHTLAHPVEGVDWTDCDTVLARIGLVLPTEAQWEYAARGGTATIWWTGDDKAGLAGAANLADLYCRDHGGPPGFPYESLDDGFAFHAPVGSFRPNPFGLHDTAGNLWEWCRDGFLSYGEFAARPGDGLREGGARAATRVIRGGGFMSTCENLRSARRDAANPDGRIDYRGLRPARPLDP